MANRREPAARKTSLSLLGGWVKIVESIGSGRRGEYAAVNALAAEDGR
jgi:hypothetical protein